MKKTSVILIFLVLVSSLWAGQWNSDFRSLSMGGINSEGSFTFASNPALLYFDSPERSLDVQFGYIDGFLLGSGESFPADPSAGFSVSFTGPKIAFGFDTLYFLSNGVRTDHVSHFTALQTIGINFSVATGFSNFGFGAGLSGGSDWQRLNIPIKKGRALLDYLSQSFFAPYDRKENSEFLRLSAGMIAKFGDFSFGLASEDIIEETGSKTYVDWKYAWSNVTLGLYYSQSPFLKRGRLNPWVFSIGAEVRSLGSDANQSLHVGGEICFQLLKDYSISLRSGYSALFSDIANGIHTMGLGLKLDFADISLLVNVPWTRKSERLEVGFCTSFEI